MKEFHFLKYHVFKILKMLVHFFKDKFPVAVFVNQIFNKSRENLILKVQFNLKPIQCHNKLNKLNKD